MEDYNDINDQSDPLFLGLTRPTMVYGVSYEAVLFAGIFTAIFFLAFGNPLCLLIYFPIHAICYLICLKDPRAFRLLALWLNTKGKANSRDIWKISTVSPFYNTRKDKKTKNKG